MIECTGILDAQRLSHDAVLQQTGYCCTLDPSLVPMAGRLNSALTCFCSPIERLSRIFRPLYGVRQIPLTHIFAIESTEGAAIAIKRCGM